MTTSSSVEALAVRCLVAHGLEVHEVDVEGVEVGLPGDPDARRATLSFGSLRRVLAMAPHDEHEARIAAWGAAAAAVLRGERPPGPVQERLVPRLLGAPDPRLWTTALADGLHLAVAEDLPGRQRLLTPFDLPRLGLAVADLRDRAVRNLAGMTPPPEALDAPRGAMTWRVGDGLDAARMLLLCQPPLRTLGALAVVPARDLCWWIPVVGDRTVRDGVHLWLAARRLGPVPYPLSPKLWWAHAGGIDPVDVRMERGAVHVVLPESLAVTLRTG